MVSQGAGRSPIRRPHRPLRPAADDAGGRRGTEGLVSLPAGWSDKVVCPALICLVCLCFSLGFPLTGQASGSIYYYRDDQGVLHFTDLPDSRKYKPYMVFGAAADRLDKRSILELIRKYSRMHGMDSLLVQAVLEVESSYDVQACSQAGAEGLMQIMPETQKDLGLNTPFDPAANIEAGVRYLKMMLERFPDIETALAAYNAGPTCVREYEGIPPYPETRRYVDKVITAYSRMQGGD